MPDQTAGRPAGGLRLVVRRIIAATPERLFAAWTQPEQLKKWWGPEGVICIGAEIDLRVGGRYRIGNQFPDGKVLWISGEYWVIERPTKLVYTWCIEPESTASEIVTVLFQPRENRTEVVVTHDRIPDISIRKQHEQGWHGCLNGLMKYIES